MVELALGVIEPYMGRLATVSLVMNAFLATMSTERQIKVTHTVGQ